MKFLNEHTDDILAPFLSYWWMYLTNLYYISPRRNVSTQHMFCFVFPPADFVAWTSNIVTSSPRETLLTCEE